ncbi:YdcF family protein [Roseomonas sp. SSH11]|uniref:YdcF family protein n=1 Tax=Pararoseomonas baculiformis TaxID=2820812 RepID=A0ABS4AHK5_9PROT|nr:YdcF family protein [Pararoseomonas baculiformis]MBP0446351.1 YdcF family protein [Pararoseomonas baculiformis]
MTDAPAPRRRRLPLLSATLAMVVLGGAGGLVWFLHRAATPWPEAPPTPGIVVLTGGPDRVEEGFTLLARRPEARLLISGVGPESTLADLVRASGAAEAGLDPASLSPRVSLGRGATSTRGNAREVAAWAEANGLREITVITAAYHMPRALLELRRGMPEAELHPHPVSPFLARPMPMLREYVKLVGALFGISVLTERTRPEATGQATR